MSTRLEHGAIDTLDETLAVHAVKAQNGSLSPGQDANL